VAWLRRGLLAACGAALFACSVYTEDLLEGGAAACEEPDDCAGSDTACSQRTCDDEICGLNLTPAGAACNEEGGSVCNGAGRCVQCVTEEQCPPGLTCNADHMCQEGKADNGAPCLEPGACLSDFCVDGHCCESACAAVCMQCNLADSEGLCAPIPAGEDPQSECGSDVCSGSGTCRCNDGTQNGDETALDCGGPVCNGCPNGSTCQTGADCISNHCPAGTCQASPACGNNTPDVGEECDDGNSESFDGCSASCLDEAPHLLISEIVVTPTEGELIEIYNPTSAAVSLSDVYLADLPLYYQVTQGPVAVGSSDFVARFPLGATIAAHAFVTVAVQSASDFNGAYGKMPDYVLDASAGGTAMLGDIGGSATLTNTAELVILFRWNGSSPTVTDLDYLVYGSTTGNAVDKTGVTGYLPDTPASSQAAAPAPGSGQSIHRCDTAESTETKTGGNGSGGHDETSETLSVAFKLATAPSPGLPPSAGFCL
jgi:hypothetical protein